MTSDTLFEGRLIVSQERYGYRFSLDAILLARLTRVKPIDRVIELGSGCGVVLLVLAYLNLGSKLVGLEIQPELLALGRSNVEANHFAEKIHLMDLDLRHASQSLPAGQFDLLISNPPYRSLGSGRVNPHRQRALARHELTASVSDVCAAGSHLLHQGGRLALIYPSSRLDHLMAVCREFGFTPKELTVIYSTPSSFATLVHLECRKGGGSELKIASPLYIYQEDGCYSETMQNMFLA